MSLETAFHLIAGTSVACLLLGLVPLYWERRQSQRRTGAKTSIGPGL